MRVVYFTHSLVSCWNHGNAHFQRGVLRELAARGHGVLAVEAANGWSRRNLIGDHGEAPLAEFAAAFPALPVTTYASEEEAEAAVDGADVVIVHEWTEPGVVARLGRLRRAGGRFRLLFHDTHHRAVSDPGALRAIDLSDYDAVLAFGAALAEVYRRWGWGRRAFVWHEAADTRLFRPPPTEGHRAGIAWVGNWGDGERSRELQQFLLKPAAAAGLSVDVYGVRYPEAALARLAAFGARYRGWLANVRVPQVMARHLATVHVPRRFYARLLPGIPTIRVFEALACGIPLISTIWEDTEGLFRPEVDFLTARTGGEVARHLRALAEVPALRADLAANGLRTIRARHSCAHRVDELMRILTRLNVETELGAA